MRWRGPIGIVQYMDSLGGFPTLVLSENTARVIAQPLRNERTVIRQTGQPGLGASKLFCLLRFYTVSLDANEARGKGGICGSICSRDRQICLHQSQYTFPEYLAPENFRFVHYRLSQIVRDCHPHARNREGFPPEATEPIPRWPLVAKCQW